MVKEVRRKQPAHGRWAGCLALVLAAHGAASAQSPVLPSTPRFEDLRPAPATTPATVDLPAARPARELGKPDGALRLDVTRYVVDDDAPAALREALERLTLPYVGVDRPYEDLLEAADEVTRFLQRELGLYLGFAYLPEQAPTDGVVRLAVMEGRLDEVVLNWEDGLPVDREVVEAYLARLRPGAVLTVREVERVVFLVNDLRGISARFELREGRTPGTAALVVTPRADARWSRRVEFDVDGARFSGIGRLGLQAAWNSPRGRGDALTFAGLVSQTGGLRFGLVGYTTPVGDDGLKLGASLSAFHYRFDRNALAIGLSGDAWSASAFVMRPMVRSRNLNLFTVLSAELRGFEDREAATSNVVRKHSQELRAALGGDFRDDVFGGGVSTYELSATAGRVAFDTPRSPYNDDAQRFAKLGLAVTRLQSLVGERLLAYVSWRGQWALRNLDSSQQFRLGGPDGVRAYAPGERSGDGGQLLSLELRWLPPEAWIGPLAREMVLSAFYDVGQVRLRHDATAQRRRDPGFDNHATLAGAGVGIAWERPQRYALRLSLALPTVGRAVGDTVQRRPRVYGAFSASF